MDLINLLSGNRRKPETRHVNIEITYDETKIWVYDLNLMTGQHVKSVEEIQLEGMKEAREKLNTNGYGPNSRGEQLASNKIPMP